MYSDEKIVFGLFFAVLFAIIGSMQGAKRKIGSTAGGFLGFFLSFIGLIIVLCSPELQDLSKQSELLPKQPEVVSVTDEIKKFKELLDMGAITEDEYNVQKERLLNL